MDGNDKIFGLSGKDKLSGDIGNDTLTGGIMKDIFVFNMVTESAAGANRDVITDFCQSQLNKINLRALDAIAGGANDAFHLTTGNGAGGFAGAAGELRHHYLNGNTIIARDVNADLVADFAICLTGIHVLTAEDFILQSRPLQPYPHCPQIRHPA